MRRGTRSRCWAHNFANGLDASEPYTPEGGILWPANYVPVKANREQPRLRRGPGGALPRPAVGHLAGLLRVLPPGCRLRHLPRGLHVNRDWKQQWRSASVARPTRPERARSSGASSRRADVWASQRSGTPSKRYSLRARLTFI